MATSSARSGAGNSAEAADFDAVIGASTRVRGRVTGDGDLLVEGQVDGDITVRGDVTIEQGARATSAVDAFGLTVRGDLEGDIRASGVVRIELGARVRGDIQGDLIALEEGAEFVGRLDATFELPPELSGGNSGSGRRR